MASPLRASITLNSRYAGGTEIGVIALGRSPEQPGMAGLATLVASTGAASLLTYASAPELRSLAAALNAAAAAIEAQSALSSFIRNGVPA